MNKYLQSKNIKPKTYTKISKFANKYKQFNPINEKQQIMELPRLKTRKNEKKRRSKIKPSSLCSQRRRQKASWRLAPWPWSLPPKSSAQSVPKTLLELRIARSPLRLLSRVWESLKALNPVWVFSLFVSLLRRKPMTCESQLIEPIK